MQRYIVVLIDVVLHEIVALREVHDKHVVLDNGTGPSEVDPIVGKLSECRVQCSDFQIVGVQIVRATCDCKLKVIVSAYYTEVG